MTATLLAGILLSQAQQPLPELFRDLLTPVVRAGDVEVKCDTHVGRIKDHLDLVMKWEKGRVMVTKQGVPDKPAAQGDGKAVTFPAEGRFPQVTRKYQTLTTSGRPEDIFIGFLFALRHGNGARGIIYSLAESPWFVTVQPLAPILLEAVPDPIEMKPEETSPYMRFDRLAFVIDKENNRVDKVVFDQWLGNGGGLNGGARSRIIATIIWPANL